MRLLVSLMIAIIMLFGGGAAGVLSPAEVSAERGYCGPWNICKYSQQEYYSYWLCDTTYREYYHSHTIRDLWQYWDPSIGDWVTDHWHFPHMTHRHYTGNWC